MKKIAGLLFISSLLLFAACQPKPKTEEASVDSTALMSTDTTMMADSTSTMTTDSAQ